MVEAGGVLDLRLERQDEYNRFLPLVKWLLVIPHLIVLAANRWRTRTNSYATFVATKYPPFSLK